jgi:signal transduction histidine kinase
VQVRGESDHVAISVHNYGAVITPRQLDGIFNPTRKRSGARDAWGKGPTGSLGLGLCIAERIVSAHNGRVDVESSDASGTSFTVLLPRGEETTLS